MRSPHCRFRIESNIPSQSADLSVSESSRLLHCEPERAHLRHLDVDGGSARWRDHVLPIECARSRVLQLTVLPRGDSQGHRFFQPIESLRRSYRRAPPTPNCHSRDIPSGEDRRPEKSAFHFCPRNLQFHTSDRRPQLDPINHALPKLDHACCSKGKQQPSRYPILNKNTQGQARKYFARSVADHSIHSDRNRGWNQAARRRAWVLDNC